MSETDDRPIDHVVLCWARVARSVGEDVRVLQRGESGGVGQFANDELLSDGDLNWQRFYADGGAVVIVPHDPVLDEITGRRVRVERDDDGVVQVYFVREDDPSGARPAGPSPQGPRATGRDGTPPARTSDQTPTLGVDAADDAPTEIIALDQMPTLSVRVDHVARAPHDDRTRDVRVSPGLLGELGGADATREDATREVAIDLDLLRRLDAARATRTREPGRLERVESGGAPEAEGEELLEVEDADKTWDVSIDPEFIASLLSKS